MPQLNIVLVEPRIPQNAGNVARTCAATGARLHLVEPLGFGVDDVRLKRAGLDYWPYLDITTHSSLDVFLDSIRDKPRFYFTTKATQAYTTVDYPDGCYLVFGREDAGLPEALLHTQQSRCVRLPMRGGLRSLNLSNAVAVGTYEALRQWDFPQLEQFGRLHEYNWEDKAFD